MSKNKVMVVFDIEVLKVMANGLMEERTVCPICGNPKDVHRWTCLSCKKHSWLAKQKAINLKIKLSPIVFEKACEKVKKLFEDSANRYASYRVLVNHLVKSMPEVKRVNEMLPKAALEGAARKVRYKVFGTAEIEEEYREKFRQFLSELPHEAKVEIDVKTPLGKFADSEKFIGEGLVIEGVRVPGRFIIDACNQINVERKAKHKKWHKGAWQNLIDMVKKDHIGYIDILKIIQLGFVYKGKSVSDKMIQAACLEVINERQYSNRPWVVATNVKKAETSKPRATKNWAYNPCGTTAES